MNRKRLFRIGCGGLILSFLFMRQVMGEDLTKKNLWGRTSAGNPPG